MEKIKILVVDDEEAFTWILKLQLEKAGPYDVCTENDPTAALQTARAFKPDIILLDVVMPEMDGGDVKAQLEEDPALREIPVLMVTALVSNNDAPADAVVQSGSDVMLAKPVRTEKLIAAIKQRLAGVI